jgi:hypothetical protein
MNIIDKIDYILCEEKKVIDFTKDDEIIRLATNLNKITYDLMDLKKSYDKFPNDTLKKHIGNKHKERNLAHKELNNYIDKLMEY